MKLKATLIVFLCYLSTFVAPAGETLYNGIELSDEWPPRAETFARENPPPPPYLAAPPAVIPIDVGRQFSSMIS